MKTNLIIIFFSILLFTACNNEAKSSYEEIKLTYNSIVNQNPSPEALSLLISQIDSHVSKFPSFEFNSELEEMKSSILMLIERTIFESIEEKFNSAQSESFQDYESAVKKYNEIRYELKEYISNAQSTDNYEKANNYLATIENLLQNIESEKSEFDNVIYSNDIELIEGFLINYPYSVMKNTLIDKIDELVFTEFMNDFNNSPNTINELNNCVSDAKSCLNKLKNIDAKSKISELISNLESRRQQILDMELSNGLPLLLEQMEDEAKEKAERAHSTYNVEMCVARGSNPEMTGNSGTIERQYEVNLVGSFMGVDKRTMEIVVTGRIKGDLQRGVDINITGSKVVSDKKTYSVF